MEASRTSPKEPYTPLLLERIREGKLSPEDVPINNLFRVSPQRPSAQTSSSGGSWFTQVPQSSAHQRPNVFAYSPVTNTTSCASPLTSKNTSLFDSSIEIGGHRKNLQEMVDGAKHSNLDQPKDALEGVGNVMVVVEAPDLSQILAAVSTTSSAIGRIGSQLEEQMHSLGSLVKRLESLEKAVADAGRKEAMQAQSCSHIQTCLQSPARRTLSCEQYQDPSPKKQGSSQSIRSHSPEKTNALVSSAYKTTLSEEEKIHLEGLILHVSDCYYKNTRETLRDHFVALQSHFHDMMAKQSNELLCKVQNMGLETRLASGPDVFATRVAAKLQETRMQIDLAPLSIMLKGMPTLCAQVSSIYTKLNDCAETHPCLDAVHQRLENASLKVDSPDLCNTRVDINLNGDVDGNSAALYERLVRELPQLGVPEVLRGLREMHDQVADSVYDKIKQTTMKVDLTDVSTLLNNILQAQPNQEAYEVRIHDHIDKMREDLLGLVWQLVDVNVESPLREARSVTTKCVSVCEEAESEQLVVMRASLAEAVSSPSIQSHCTYSELEARKDVKADSPHQARSVTTKHVPICVEAESEQLLLMRASSSDVVRSPSIQSHCALSELEAPENVKAESPLRQARSITTRHISFCEEAESEQMLLRRASSSDVASSSSIQSYCTYSELEAPFLACACGYSCGTATALARHLKKFDGCDGHGALCSPTLAHASD